MSARGFFLVVVTALLTVAGNLLMREGVVRGGGLTLSAATVLRGLFHLARQPLFDLGVLLYGLASVIWFAVISTEKLNSSYPLLVSATFLLVTLGATWLFREPMPLQKAVGVGVLLAGILLVATAK